MNWKNTIAILVCICAWHIGLAQQVTASVDSNKFLIGDWIPLKLEVIADKNADITFPIISDEDFEELEVLKVSDIDSLVKKKAKTYFQTITLTVFDTGYYPIPAFDFVVNGDTISSTPSIVQITSVEVDTVNAEIKAIKPPMTEKLTFWERIYPWGIILPIILAALLFFGLAIYLLNKRPKQVAPPKPAITIPAHQWAYGELKKLKAEELWQNGENKAFFSQLTDILRQYIELRYKQPAMESTSDEIMQRLKLLKLDTTLLEQIQTTLSVSDYVKFAKAKPMAHECEESFATIQAFVDKTKLIEQPKIDNL